MSTIRIIARKEFTEMLRDGRFRWSCAVIFGLLVLSIIAGAKHRIDAHSLQTQAQEEDRRIWLEQGEKTPHSAAHQGMYAFNPSPLLSAFDKGITPYVGSVVWMEAHRQNDSMYRPVQDATEIQRFGELSAAMILQLLLPLVIIFLTFSAIAGERERGTLRQVMSVGIKPMHLMAGKALGIGGALGLLLVVSGLVAITALAMSGPGEFVASIPRAVLLAACYLIYLLVFLAIGLAVSAASRSSRQALVVLLGFWIFNGLIAPKVAAGIADGLVPTPSAFEFDERIAQAKEQGREKRVNGHDMNHPGTRALLDPLFAQYGVDKVEDLPFNFRGVALAEGEKAGNEIYDAHFGKLWEDYEAQDRLQASMGFAAPILTIRAISMALAGTDFRQHRHFATAAETHRRDFIQTLNDDVKYNSSYGSDYVQGAELWEKARAFTYEPPGVAWAVQHVIPAMGMLLAWLVVTAGGAILMIRKLDFEPGVRDVRASSPLSASQRVGMEEESV